MENKFGERECFWGAALLCSNCGHIMRTIQDSAGQRPLRYIAWCDNQNCYFHDVEYLIPGVKLTPLRK